MTEYCTFYDTCEHYQLQLTGQCFDCFNDQNHAICINCLKRCHRGHRITNIRINSAFCDCKNAERCKCVKLVNATTDTK